MKGMIISFVADMKLRGLANTLIDNVKLLSLYEEMIKILMSMGRKSIVVGVA